MREKVRDTDGAKVRHSHTYRETDRQTDKQS